jgi:hypothetical protein
VRNWVCPRGTQNFVQRKLAMFKKLALLITLCSLTMLTACSTRTTLIPPTKQTASNSAAAEKDEGNKPQVCGDADGEGGPWKPLPYRSDRNPNTQASGEDTLKTQTVIRAQNCRQAEYCGLPIPAYCKK